MSIIEAIKRAETEHAVYFLLTAYIESLWDNQNDNGLRGPLWRLPIDGQTDVQERAKVLALEERAAEGPTVSEAAEIFRVASQKLDSGRVAG